MKIAPAQITILEGAQFLVADPLGDVSSGVERARGEKDPALIREFVARVRAIGV